jgi:hypothetical protein
MTIDFERPPNMGPIVEWMYDFWRSKFHGDRRPSKNQMDPVEIAATNPTILRHICLYDVERQPFRFRYRLIGGAIPDAGGLARVGNYMDEVDQSGRVDVEFGKIRDTGAPWHKIGPALILHRTQITTVESLVVPLNGAQDRIDYLLSCSVYQWEDGYAPAQSFGTVKGA